MLRYDFTATFEYGEAANAPGTLTGFFEYEEGVGGGSFGSFGPPFLTFEITFGGGPKDGEMFSSVEGQGSLYQNNSDGTTFITMVGDNQSTEDVTFRFGGNFTDRDVTASINLADFIEGHGYGSVPFTSSLNNMVVNAQLAPVPNPATGLLLGAAAGGASLLSAAKKRRAKKRAAAAAPD